MECNLTKLEQQALEQMELHKEELFQLLCMLIQYDSQNFGGSGREQECAEFIRDIYTKAGLDTQLYYPDFVPGVVEHPAYWPGEQTDRRPNVTGIRWGSDRSSRVMLAAHIDTMPAGDLSAWDASPFLGVQKDDRIYGLGSNDNKSAIAAAYWAMKILDDMGVKLKKSVALTSYCDEEFGGGNGALAACLAYPCETYVNLDGGNYEMWATALGGGCYQLKLQLDYATDDFMPVYKALSAVMEELDGFGDWCRQEMRENPFYDGTPMADSALRISSVGCTGETHRDAQVSFVVYTPHTKEEVDARLQEILVRLAPELKRLKVTTSGFEHTTRFFQYGEADLKAPAFAVMHGCAQDAAGRKVDIKGSCLTDLSVFFAAGGDACSFNFGVLRDFSLVGGAHQPNEYVDCQEFLNHTKALILFLLRYCGVEEA